MLTTTDLTILLEAMDAWIAKDDFGEAMSGLFTAALADKKDPEMSRYLNEHTAQRKMEHSRAKEMRSEVAILLKAKLVQLRRDAQSREYQDEGRIQSSTS